MGLNFETHYPLGLEVDTEPDTLAVVAAATVDVE